jgi:hypothetical protein
MKNHVLATSQPIVIGAVADVIWQIEDQLVVSVGTVLVPQFAIWLPFLALLFHTSNRPTHEGEGTRNRVDVQTFVRRRTRECNLAFL